jgi:hypothetical protein
MNMSCSYTLFLLAKVIVKMPLFEKAEGFQAFWESMSTESAHSDGLFLKKPFFHGPSKSTCLPKMH